MHARGFELLVGGHFGDVPMIMGLRNTVDVVAETVCDLYTLDKRDLDEVLSHYSDMKGKLEKDAQERIDQAHLKHRTEKVKLQRGSSVGPPSNSKPHVKHSLMQGHSVARKSTAPLVSLMGDKQKHRQQFRQSTLETSNATAEEEEEATSGRDKWVDALKLYWQYIVAAAALCSVLLVTFEAAFVTESVGVAVFGYLLDAVLQLNIGIRLWNWHMEGNGQLEWKQIIVTFVADFPADLVLLLSGVKGQAVSRARLNHAFRCVLSNVLLWVTLPVLHPLTCVTC